MNMLCLVVCGALLATAPALAEKAPSIGDGQADVLLTLSVGDGTITGEHVAPYRIAWHGTLYPENGQPIDGGIWVQQLRRVELGGREVLVRTAGSLLFKRTSFNYVGSAAHVTVVDAKTLAPIWSEHHNPDGSAETWTYDGVHVELDESDAQGKKVARRFDLPLPAYDITGAMLWFYFPALQLRVGYGGAIPVVGDVDHPLRGLPFKVARREKVKAGARGLVDAWVVECPDPATGVAQFWFTGNAPYPVRMVIPATPGVPRTVFELVN
jgi:hypothetical protein